MIPGLNTEFLGETKAQGLWVENCLGCGDCMLYHFGGVCPLARCSKQLFNGPCGGSVEGKCEINPDVPCAWQIIVDRLSAIGARWNGWSGSIRQRTGRKSRARGRDRS